MTEITGLAVVTGASSGIGAATATAMARKGAHVVLLARRENLLREVAHEITGQGGRAHSFAVDLTDAKATAEVAKRITDEIGIPDILVNDAGAGKWRFIDETTPEQAVEMMACPYFAAFNVTHAFLPAMLKRAAGTS
jgi:NADP-dependent 3-hydroxy acid dehydrogenase YdfG